MNTQKIATELAQKLVEAERQKLVTSQLNKEVIALKAKLNEAMDDEDIPSITVKIAGGELKFDPVEEVNYKLKGPVAGMSWDDCGVFHKWLAAVGEDGLIKTKPTVHPKSRESFLKAWEEKGEALPDFIDRSVFSTTKVNKSAVTRLAKELMNDR